MAEAQLTEPQILETICNLLKVEPLYYLPVVEPMPCRVPRLPRQRLPCIYIYLCVGRVRADAEGAADQDDQGGLRVQPYMCMCMCR